MAIHTFTAGNVLPSANAAFNPSVVIAGETLTAGLFVYKKESDGLYYLADNTTAEKSTVAGIAANGATAGQRFVLITRDTVLPGCATTVQGHVYSLSATPGKMEDIADNSTTSGIFLKVLAQTSNLIESTIAFDFTRPTPGIEND